MPVSNEDRKIVEQVFEAMQAREKGEEKMVSLFADDAVLTEPFTGQPRTHRGKEAIRTFFRGAVSQIAPDMLLKLDRLDMDGARVRADWTCTTSVLPGPMRGHDLYTIQNGKIKTAEFVVTEMPEMK